MAAQNKQLRMQNPFRERQKHGLWERSTPSESGVNGVGSVGGAHNNDMRARLEAVHQRQELRNDPPFDLALRCVRNLVGNWNKTQ